MGQGNGKKWMTKTAVIAALCAMLPAAGGAKSAAFMDLQGWASEDARDSAAQGSGQAMSGKEVPLSFIKVWKDPTPDQLAVAAEIMLEARSALKAGNKNLYKAKMKKLDYFSEGRMIRKGFAGKILCEGRNGLEEEDNNSHCSDPDDVCYQGKLKDSATLLIHALKANYWNWDEEWVEKARVVGGKLMADWVDGPNELRKSFEIPLCGDMPSRPAAAKIMCDGEEAFTEETMYSCGEALVFDKVCYTGDPVEAADVIQTKLHEDEWEWDEEWVEDPRAEGPYVVVDLVDGPNDVRSVIKIPQCK